MGLSHKAGHMAYWAASCGSPVTYGARFAAVPSTDEMWLSSPFFLSCAERRTADSNVWNIVGRGALK